MKSISGRKHTNGHISRLLCSITWVVVFGWLGLVNTFFIIMLISNEHATISNNAFVIFVGVNLIVYLALSVWTAWIYRTWKQWLLALGVQAILISITALIMCYIRMYSVFRPLTLLYSSEMSGSISGIFSIGTTLIDFGITFLELCTWQFLAIGCGKLVRRAIIIMHTRKSHNVVVSEEPPFNSAN